MSERSSYRQIMKATSLFGGVQFFKIFITLVRTKFVAILLGPSGMGIAGLLNSTLNFLGALTSFGLGTSAVKNISSAYGSGDRERVSRTVKIVRRWVWLTGMLGTILTILLAPWLSEITFGNERYTYAFIWISITLLFNQVSTGQNVLLRGGRRLKYLAQASVLGSILGLIVTVPLYYFYGIDGIVPGIITMSLASLLLTWYFAKKVPVKSVEVSKKETFQEGKEMLILGFFISFSSLATLGTSHIVRIFVSNEGGVDDVGLYNAGFAIINNYVGMIFTAMSTDYYPRLSAISHDKDKSEKVINQQAEISILILSPVIIIFMVFIRYLIIILYSTKFLPIDEMLHFAVLGIFFKAIGWSLGFLLLAKASTKLFFWSELSFNLYLLILNVIGFKIWGLSGLGMAFTVSYFIYMIQILLIVKSKFKFEFSRGFKKIFLQNFVLALGCFMTIKFLSGAISIIIGCLFIIASILLVYRDLNNRMDLNSLFLKFKNKLGWKKKK